MKLIFPVIFLSLFGLFNLFGLDPDLFWNQLGFTVIAMAGFFALRSFGYRFFHINSRVFYWLLILLIVITFIIGGEIKGSRRWLNLYFFNFQASEFLKPFFILYLSEILTTKSVFRNNFRGFMESVFYFIVPFLLIFKQPDLGNAMVFMFIYIIMLFFSDVYKKFIWYFFGAIAMLTPLSWLFLKDYQKSRILSFFNPHLDTQGIAYNMIQAVITIGSGSFFGRGLGLGTQSRFYFLPESNTDFAYASLVEQFGFFGGLMVLLFYGLLVWGLLGRIMEFYYQRTDQGKRNFLYAMGLTSYIFFQIAVNIGMNLGLLPVAGVALPFISYGGSSILAFMIGLALLP